MSVTAQPSSAQLFAYSDAAERACEAQAILAAVVYADLFDYPLTIDELVRFQVGTRQSHDQIKAALAAEPLLSNSLVEESEFYALRGRENTGGLRTRRTLQSKRLWPKARAYARITAHLPFVRFVAVTGALAVENLGARPDIDFLVVAATDRVWICRRALILLVRCARLFGDDLCPNYIISENSLTLDQRDFFTAHELAQMVPLVGRDYYRQMISSNDWAAKYLPYAFNRSAKRIPNYRRGVIKLLLESLLRLKIFNLWEEWELARMRKQLRPILGTAAEVVCSRSQCKGHTGLHRQTVLTRYVNALKSRGLVGPLLVVEQAIEAD